MKPTVTPDVIRPRLIFEAASHMMSNPSWPYRAAGVELFSHGDEQGRFRLFGANHPDTLRQVHIRALDISILNPAALMTMAHLGVGYFRQPMHVATIAVLPHYDQLGFAISKKLGVSSLADIRERRIPLRLSVRGSLDACTSIMVNEVLKVHGFTIEDIASWGGSISYDQPMPNHPSRMGRAEAGKLDAIFDEGIMMWGDMVEPAGMHFLPIADAQLAQLQALGFRRGVIERFRYPTLAQDVQTVDFSGWPIFTRADTSDELITAFCEALVARRGRIPWDIGGDDQPPLPLERMCRDSAETPLDVPFHPAAERIWNTQGFLNR
jgi:TRAP-type uncharacterized transport system substrate-binding protein